MSKRLLTVSMSCALCEKHHERTVSMPDGWDSRYRAVEEEKAFCPEHAIIAAFCDSQCPGCVGGWGDCPLYKSFAFGKLTLSANDFSTLESGICPKRVNGTMMFGGGKLEHVDLRETPVAIAGQALSVAIKSYALKYHK